MRRITRSMTTKDASGGDDTAASTSSTSHAVEDNENGSSGNSSGSLMMTMTTSSNTATQVNPLLMEDYLEKLFPYLNDRKTLTSVRLVNKAWNHTSASALKKALTWRVGPFKNSEQRFRKAMSKLSRAERCRTFRNFTLKHKTVHLPKRSGCVGKHVDKFMQEFGQHMIDLKIKSMDINYVREHLKQTFLTNLEHLEFYDMSQSVLGDPLLYENTDLFTEVRSLSFNPTRGDWSIEEGDFTEGKGRICFNMLKACPNLKQLEINLRRTTLSILRDVNSELNLTSLTSFKNSLRHSDYENSPSTVIFRPTDFYALVRKCPNLKVISVNLSDVASKTEISRMLSKYSAQLEELHISILEEGRLFTRDGEEEQHANRHPDWNLSSEESEGEVPEVGQPQQKQMKVDDCKFCKSKLRKVKKHGLPFPDFPLLKKLVIISWFYNDLDKLGNMPLLQEIDIKMKEGVALQLVSTPAVSYPSVRSLKFHCAFGRYWSSAAFCNNEDCLKAPMVAPLISIFPNVTELDVEVADDEALRNLFSALAGCGGGQIKRLHLSKSEISDSGITGIQWTEQLKLAHNENDLSMDALVAEYRIHPFIGLLTGLQELTYKRNNLTYLSVEFGLISLKELTSLKLPPYKFRRQRAYLYFQPNLNHIYYEYKSLVHVRALVDNLKYLVKLDVNDDSDLEEEERKWRMVGNESGPAHDNKFKGCGISVQDLDYIKEHAPNVEIVYSELKISP